MAAKNYPLTPAKIGNASGFRLPASFYRDYPQFANAAGFIEVLSDKILLIRLESNKVDQDEDEGDALMLSLFLDFITKDALHNPEHLEAYTEAMAAEDDELLAGVTLDP